MSFFVMRNNWGIPEYWSDSGNWTRFRNMAQPYTWEEANAVAEVVGGKVVRGYAI